MRIRKLAVSTGVAVALAATAVVPVSAALAAAGPGTVAAADEPTVDPAPEPTSGTQAPSPTSSGPSDPEAGEPSEGARKAFGTVTILINTVAALNNRRSVSMEFGHAVLTFGLAMGLAASAVPALRSRRHRPNPTSSSSGAMTSASPTSAPARTA